MWGFGRLVQNPKAYTLRALTPNPKPESVEPELQKMELEPKLLKKQLRACKFLHVS